MNRDPNFVNSFNFLNNRQSVGGGQLSGKIQFSHTYKDIISLENLLEAWREFILGKKSRKDTQEFSKNLLNNLKSLHSELVSGKYRHSHYTEFNIFDPKPRLIHKATVRDRVLHHAIYRKLYPFFNRTFIFDSYSCRIGKGTHKAIYRFQSLAANASRNHTITCWVLKCDIQKFFASIDHQKLLKILTDYIPDKRILWLLKQLVDSFAYKPKGRGLPLGNLTSQLFCNIYMNEFDQFVKHKLKATYYVRYADDFVLMSGEKNYLIVLVDKISEFLKKELHLFLHPDKISIKTLSSGIDFLGWVHFSGHRVLRTVSKRRMFKRINQHPSNETLQSYLGLISYGNTQKVKSELLHLYRELKR